MAKSSSARRPPPSPKTSSWPGLTATGNDDKDIATADLAKMLKDTTPVFFLQKPMSADLKAKFKRTAIFLEYTEPKTVEKK
jgi:hypothetical protein